MRADLLTSLRVSLGTLALTGLVYPGILLAFARLAAPGNGEGSLIRDSAGIIVGSRSIAQRFDRPEYLWPRPSAVDYDASGAGGSNQSPGNPTLRERSETQATRLGAVPGNPVPAELVSASGSGLDPHISLDGARYQAPRIADARGVSNAAVIELFERSAARSTPWTTRLVNVLESNLELDRRFGSLEAR
jgi:K+-transporting ATPase ATPase C chain